MSEDYQDSLRTERHERIAAMARQVDAHHAALAAEHEAGRLVVKWTRHQRDILAPDIVAWIDAWDATELAT